MKFENKVEFRNDRKNYILLMRSLKNVNAKEKISRPQSE
jgi:hypothetical protein